MIIKSSKNFNKQLARIPKNVEINFFERLKIFKTNSRHPLLKNHKLHGELSGHRSININSDIRAIYKQNENMIIFVAIGTHSELYQ